jgi:hypothetical protein
LKRIALNGRLSQKEAMLQFGYTAPTISEALAILRTKRKLIEQDTTSPPPDFKSGERHKKFYKLTTQGLIEFINGNPSPYEFWIALIHYCNLNSEAINKNQLNKYYNLFIQKFVGDSFSLRSCFFLSNSFDNLFKKWRSTYDGSECNKPGTPNYFKHPQTIQAYKVFECLLENRAATIERIVELTELTEHQVRKTLQDYSIITRSDYYHHIELYESAYHKDRSIGITTDYLSHLIIVPIREKEGNDTDKNSNKDEKYELSLLGILLILATISLMRKERGQKISSSADEYYNRMASNYQDKLPLIFGKWNLLKRVLKFDFFPSIFDYLFLDKPEILSLSVLLGGNKEIYDNIRSAALSTVNKFFMVYEDGISAIHSDDSLEEFVKNKHHQFIQGKLNEIQLSLRYADLESFSKHMIGKKPKPTLAHVSLTFKDMPSWKVNKLFVNNQEEKDFDFNDEMQSIEHALADEFSLLFYIGLLRDNNHKASDYPLTVGFTRPSPNLIYPKYFLLQIIRSDGKVRKQLAEWIREATTYQRLALKKMSDTCAELEKQQLHKTNKILRK